MDEFDGFDRDLDALGREMEGVKATTQGLALALREMRGGLGLAERDLGRLERGFSGGLRRAFDGLVLDGGRLSDALNTVARSMVDTVYDAAVRPVAGHVGGLIAGGLNAAVAALMPFAKGGAFAQGRVTPFAKGGVVTAPTAFPMRGGAGLMGEAGPEAVMPLSRGADGRLGVRAEGRGGGVNVVINVTTPDVAGFARSQSQIAAQVSRALARAGRNS